MAKQSTFNLVATSGIQHDGVIYGEGDQFEVADEATAQALIATGAAILLADQKKRGADKADTSGE